jgi:hypothetical protein
LSFIDETGLAVAIDPQYRHCNKKRVIGAVNQPLVSADDYSVTRRDSGNYLDDADVMLDLTMASENLLYAIKALCQQTNGFAVLTKRVLGYCCPPFASFCRAMEQDGVQGEGTDRRGKDISTLVDWKSQFVLQPIYLLGRCAPSTASTPSTPSTPSCIPYS